MGQWLILSTMESCSIHCSNCRIGAGLLMEHRFNLAVRDDQSDAGSK
jgi:hypothetical protein